MVYYPEFIRIFSRPYGSETKYAYFREDAYITDKGTVISIDDLKEYRYHSITLEEWLNTTKKDYGFIKL